MPYRRIMFALPCILLTGLGSALLGIPAASAQERITLESIGAVRMARLDAVRRADPEVQPATTRPARAQSAERPAKAR